MPDLTPDPGPGPRLVWREDARTAGAAPPGAPAPVLALTGPTPGAPAGPTLADSAGDDPGQVAAARARLAAALGLPGGRVLYPRQVHGREVAVATGPWPTGGAPAVDAVVTRVPGLALAVLVADCVPVLLADAGAGVVGVAHAGRRGMDAGVVGAAVAAMRALGAERVTAVLGPSVCGRCYAVPAAMRDDVAARHPAAAATTRSGEPALDVAAGVLAQLERAGVPARCVPGCTVERADLGSVRRQGPGAPRWAGLAWLAPGPGR